MAEPTADSDAWRTEVRRPVERTSEGKRTLRAGEDAEASYDIAALPDGRWAVRVFCAYHGFGGSAIPWTLQATREECLQFFVRQAETHFRQALVGSLIAKSRIKARDKMLALLQRYFQKGEPPSIPSPTPRDHENARIRQEIADKQEAEYVECLQWALGHFGPGWLPAFRHFLVTKEAEERARHSGNRTQAATTVYTVRHADGRNRHFTVEDGRVVEHASYQHGFGEKLLEPHPTRTIEVQGQLVHPHHYSLCFAPYVLYKPKTAEQLAELRSSRGQKKAEREEKQFAKDCPLFAPSGQQSET